MSKSFWLVGLALVGCADKNAPNAATFEKLILASPLATRPLCLGANLRMIYALPGSFYPADFQKTDYDDYRTLARLGYVSISEVDRPAPFSFSRRPIKLVVVTPTKKWKNQHNSGCPGVWQAQHVKNFTPPAPLANGMTATTVTVVGEQHYTDWATEPELRQMFLTPNTPLPVTAERNYLLVLKNTGWEVAGEQ